MLLNDVVDSGHCLWAAKEAKATKFCQKVPTIQDPIRGGTKQACYPFTHHYPTVQLSRKQTHLHPDLMFLTVLMWGSNLIAEAFVSIRHLFIYLKTKSSVAPLSRYQDRNAEKKCAGMCWFLAIS